jgi:hypothetical protein
MDAVNELTKIDTRLAEARHALRAIDEEQRRALADVKTAEAALADHFSQEHVDELEPRDLHNNLRRPQPCRAALAATPRG